MFEKLFDASNEYGLEELLRAKKFHCVFYKEFPMDASD